MIFVGAVCGVGAVRQQWPGCGCGVKKPLIIHLQGESMEEKRTEGQGGNAGAFCSPNQGFFGIFSV